VYVDFISNNASVDVAVGFWKRRRQIIFC